MLSILLAATVAASAPPAAAHSHLTYLLALAQRAEGACPNVRQEKTAASDKPGLKKLGDLPDAEAYHAVMKEAGGCPIDEVFENGRWVDRWGGPRRGQLRHAGGER